jgi:hypothetical protein
MPRRLTQEEFICRSVEIHGDKYDYSDVVYVSSKIKVEIYCKEHKEHFSQTPNSHLSGRGCKLCGNDATHDRCISTKEEFIEKAKKIHGDEKYDYSNVNYMGCKTNVEIYCNTHKEYFPQTPDNHLQGRGCRLCRNDDLHNRFVSTKEEFIIKATKIHGNKYSYDEANYINARIKIEIYCNIHKEYFPQTPDDHLSGSVCCPKCRSELQSKRQSSNIEKFIEKANIIHNFKYDYSEANYIGNHTDVKIICPIHGSFPQAPSNHLQGNGCPDCGLEQGAFKRSSSAAENFIEKANLVHNFKYDYCNVNYIGAKTEVEIICSVHGSFPQKPTDHLQGKGCPSCTHIISKPETAWLDSLNVPNDPEHRQVRIKIDNKIFKIDGFSPETNTIYEFDGDYYHGNPKKYPPNKVNPTNKKTFGELYARTLNKQSILKTAGYTVISIWESDYYASLKQKCR